MGIPQFLFQYTHGVGFGIAYPRQEGNAKAYKSGMSDEFRFPRFFYVDLFYSFNRLWVGNHRAQHKVL